MTFDTLLTMASKSFNRQPEVAVHPSERLKKWVETLTTSGEPQLDEAICKKIKKVCKSVYIFFFFIISSCLFKNSTSFINFFKYCKKAFYTLYSHMSRVFHSIYVWLN